MEKPGHFKDPYQIDPFSIKGKKVNQENDWFDQQIQYTSEDAASNKHLLVHNTNLEQLYPELMTNAHLSEFSLLRPIATKT